MSRIKYRSAELIEKRRRFVKKIAIIFSISFCLLSAGIIFLLRMESLQIRETKIDGINIIEKKELEQVVSNSLSGYYFWLIPKTNTFLYSIDSLNNGLTQKFPGISSIETNREGLKKLSIKIGERKPHAIWCDGNFDTNSQNCYFVDDSGIVFSQAPFFSDGVYFVYKGGVDPEKPLGSQLLNSQDFTTFEKFINHTKTKLNLDIRGVLFKEDGDFDLFLSNNFLIKLNKNDSYDVIYNNLESLLKDSQFSKIVSSLEYVDMRFGNKIFYKSKKIEK